MFKTRIYLKIRVFCYLWFAFFEFYPIFSTHTKHTPTNNKLRNFC